MVPPDVKEYLIKVIKAADQVMRTVIRHFGFDDVEAYVPKPLPAESGMAGNPGQPNQSPQLAGRTGGQALLPAPPGTIESLPVGTGSVQ